MSDTTSTPPSSTSRWVAALAVIGFPLLTLAANRFDHLTGSNPDRVRAMADHAGEQALQAVLLYVASLLLIAAVFAIGRLTYAATPKLTRAATTLGVIGAAGHIVLATYGALASNTGSGSPTEMAAFLDRVDDDPVLLPLAAGIMLYGPALVLLVVALLRARIVGWGAMAMMIAAFVLHVALPSGTPLERFDLANLLVAAVFVPLGVRIARTATAAFAAGRVEPLLAASPRREPHAEAVG